nr:PREDICTED: synembryn-A isoform X2 [Bemisia tabaci]
MLMKQFSCIGYNFYAALKHAQTFSFSELNQDDRRKKLWSILFKHLNNPSLGDCHEDCLACLRILSRDKCNLDSLMNSQWIETLLLKAGLRTSENHMEAAAYNDFAVVIESLKVLSNLLFQSPQAQAICCKNGTADGIIQRLRLYSDHQLPHMVKFFDMKVLFLLTALSPDIRPRVRDNLHGLIYLMEILDLILKQGTTGGPMGIVLHEEQVLLSCEVLKVLFNLTVRGNLRPEDEDDSLSLRLVEILREYLLCTTLPLSFLDSFYSNIINLLTNLSGSVLKHLVVIDNSQAPNMDAIAVILNFLDNRLDQKQGSLTESIMPAITVLLECSRSSREVRKYVRQIVLPPLRDTHTRPEEGNTLRNKLCSLLTSPHSHLKDLVAEFLFALCKENVERMIKYTGFGNAAGLFANRGLLLNTHKNSNNSSDSENSETEEYEQSKKDINPVTGYVEPKRPNPLAGMSEEQKEFEAMQLVSMMDKLTREGVIQPCRIGEDGRPQAVEHILQLQEDLPKQQMQNH